MHGLLRQVLCMRSGANCLNGLTTWNRCTSRGCGPIVCSSEVANAWLVSSIKRPR